MSNTPKSGMWTSEGARGPLPAALAGSARFAALAIWLCVIFILGGSSRPDMPSLLVLRPASVLFLGAGLLTLTRAHVARFGMTFAFSAAVTALIALHLVPLPPMLWSALPGRDLIVRIDQAAGLGSVWRPLSMAPVWTWNALWFMATPLSVLVHAAQLPAGQLRRLGAVLLAIGLASAVLGVAQMLGGSDGPLYLYRVSHAGSSVGLFANRNHQAVFLALMVPLALALLRQSPIRMRLDRQRAEQLDLTNAAVLLLFAALLPLIVATGSRSGLVVMVVSAVVSLILLPPFQAGAAAQQAGPRSDKRRASARRRLAGWSALALLGGLALTGVALRNDRALSIDRLSALDPRADLRSRILPVVLTMTQHYAPLGSGIGTFEPVYQIDEPDDFLAPTYANHVHNDWLEVVLTAGFPGLALLIWAVAAWFFGAWRCLRWRGRRGETRDLAVAGLVGTLLMALASLTDYPLRTPGFGAVLVFMLVWINLGLSDHDSYRRGTVKESNISNMD
jgi:O-antigen ligase